MEVDNHNTFYSTLRKLKQRWLINEKIKVPKINDYGSMNYFEMEKVNWISLANYYYKIKFKDKLNKYDDEYIDDLNDLELKKLFKKVWVKDIPEQMNEDQKEWDKMYAELYKFSEKFLEPYWFWLAMMIMEELWILHKDLHPWNLMIDKDKNVYIIDFWRVYIDNYLNNLK
jgi:thiamine kinase-like enzyme